MILEECLHPQLSSMYIKFIEEPSEPGNPASDVALQALSNMVEKANALGSDDAALQAAIKAAQAILDKEAPTAHRSRHRIAQPERSDAGTEHR